MRYTCFSGDVLVCQRFVTEQLQFFGCGNMQDVQARSGNLCQTDSQFGRGITCRNGTDTGVGTDGNVIRSFIFLLVFLDIVFLLFPDLRNGRQSAYPYR